MSLLMTRSAVGDASLCVLGDETGPVINVPCGCPEGGAQQGFEGGGSLPQDGQHTLSSGSKWRGRESICSGSWQRK